MTPCTICGDACPGTDDDDEAVCLGCFCTNLAGAELRPPASVTRLVRGRRPRWDDAAWQTMAALDGARAAAPVAPGPEERET